MEFGVAESPDEGEGGLIQRERQKSKARLCGVSYVSYG